MSQIFDRTISIQYLPYPDEAEGKQLQAGLFLFPGFIRQLDPSTRSPINSDKTVYVTGLEPQDVDDERREEVAAARKEMAAVFGEDQILPTNVQFWRDRSLTIDKKTTFLNLGEASDKLTYYMIKGGSYKEIAPNYEAAIAGSVPYRWYLVDATEFAELSVTDDRKINKAIAALEIIDEEKRFEDLFLVHKVLITPDRGITMKSPRSLLYKDLSDFIHGKIVKTNKKMTPKQFLDVADQLKKDKKPLYVLAYLRDGSYFNYLGTAEDNQIKNISTQTRYGATMEKATKFLMNPANQTELENLKTSVEKKWNE